MPRCCEICERLGLTSQLMQRLRDAPMTLFIGRILRDQVSRRDEGLVMRGPGQFDHTVEQALVRRRKDLSFRKPPAMKSMSPGNVDIGERAASPKLPSSLSVRLRRSLGGQPAKHDRVYREA